MAGGWELNFMVAIDFTASNGNSRLPDSLHYIDPSGRHNTYQKTISDIGEMLQFYDSTKRFPAWGFGARPIDGPVSHCFNLNGSSNYCEVHQEMEYDSSYSNSLWAEVDVKLMKIAQMSPEDAAAAAAAAVKEAEAVSQSLKRQTKKL